MSNKTALGMILGIVVVIAGVIYLMGRPVDNALNNDVEFTTTDQVSGENMEVGGKAVFSVTDAAADMGTISKIEMTVSGLEVHSEANGWVTIPTGAKTYSLLELDEKNESRLLAEADLQLGTYDQIRLQVDSIVVTAKDGAKEEAKLPSGEIKINTNLVVKAEGTSSVNFDFLADKSLHTTGSGDYIYAPVVKTETRSDSLVTVGTNGTVEISGGNVDDTETVGMDVDGTIKTNFEIGNKKLDIGTDNKIKVGL